MAHQDMSRIIPERLREAREAQGYTVQTFADALGITRQAVAQFEIGQAEPSSETLSKIIALVHQTPAFFTTRRTHSREQFGPVFWRSLKRLQNADRLRISRRLEWCHDIVQYLERYFEFPPVDFPAPELDVVSVLDDLDAVEQAADNLRILWKLGVGPISNLLSLLESKGVIVIREKSNAVDMDAVSQWQRGRPMIYLSSDKNISVRSRFDLSHELGHILLHAGVEIDTGNLAGIEKQANRFASAFLMPQESFSKEVVSTSLEYFVELKKRWRVSIAAMIYRCKDLNILNENQVGYLWRQMNARNIRTFEPLDDELESEKPTVLSQAIELLVEHSVQSKNNIVDELLINPADVEKLCGLREGCLDTRVVPLRIEARPVRD